MVLVGVGECRGESGGEGHGVSTIVDNGKEYILIYR